MLRLHSDAFDAEVAPVGRDLTCLRPAGRLIAKCAVEVWIMPGYLSIKVDHVRSAWEACKANGGGPPDAAGPSDHETQHARRVATVHVPQSWPHGVVCRNCHGLFPCAAAQWAIGVLKALNWQLSDLFDLLEATELGEQP